MLNDNELGRMRKETRGDMAKLVSSYLEDASENLRRALARSGDSVLTPEQRLPESLVNLLTLSRIAINAELVRRGR